VLHVLHEVRTSSTHDTKQAYKIGNVSINVTLRRVPATVVAVEKYYIFLENLFVDVGSQREERIRHL